MSWMNFEEKFLFYLAVEYESYLVEDEEIVEIRQKRWIRFLDFIGRIDDWRWCIKPLGKNVIIPLSLFQEF